MLKWFIRFPEFPEFTELNESFALFRKNSFAPGWICFHTEAVLTTNHTFYNTHGSSLFYRFEMLIPWYHWFELLVFLLLITILDKITEMKLNYIQIFLFYNLFNSLSSMNLSGMCEK